MNFLTQASESNPISSFKEDPLKFVNNNTLDHCDSSGKLFPKITNELPIAPESEDEEMDYIKNTIKNLLKAEEISIKHMNKKIDELKQNYHKEKKYLSQIFGNKKNAEAEDFTRDDAPVQEEIESLKELKEIDQINEVHQIFSLPNQRIQTFTQLFMNFQEDEAKSDRGGVKKKKLQKSPLKCVEVQSENLSFILEIEQEEEEKKKENNNIVLGGTPKSISSARSQCNLFSSKISKPGFQRKFSFKINSPAIKIILPLRIGWLKKRGKNPLKKWKKRYCKIENKKFSYYKSDKDLHPMGCLDFDLVVVKFEEIMEGKKIVRLDFLLDTPKKKFSFKNYDKKNNDLLYWSEAIKTNIKSSNGFMNSINLLNTPKFWRDLRISEKQFLEKAETLDIILFQSKHLLSKLQRSFTRSQFDHVAIVIKHSEKEISILEAEMPGVGIYQWKKFMRNKWYNLYKSVCFRHLEIERNDDFREKIDRFINIVIGNKYKLNPLKLMRAHSEILDDPLANLQERGFFCSELVACAYKFMNLLPKKKASSKYWPGSFSKEKKLSLLGKTKLGEQCMIDFSLKNCS